jgi:pentatricopeptide repeat protein
MAPSLKNILAEACKKAGYIKELLYFFRRMQKLDIFYDGIKMAMSGHSPVGNVF